MPSLRVLAPRSGTRAAPVRSGLRGLPTTLYIGAALVAVFVGVGLLSLVWTPQPLTTVDVGARLLPPGTDGYVLGTDRLGRDMLTQVMAGARTSLFISISSTVIALVPGILLGLWAAGTNRYLGAVLSRATDIGVALPGILVALVLATAIGPGIATAVLGIVAYFVPTVARITIGPARQILSRDYVEAAFAYGRRGWFVALRHVLPNIAPLLIVQASVMFASAILIETTLAYLGIGAQAPTPSWGRMLEESQALIAEAPYLTVIPGVAIMIAVLGFNLLGDGLRTILDPQQTSKAEAL